MITAASAQPVAPAGRRPSLDTGNTFGTTWGTLPSSYWSAATSPSHLVKNPATSMLNAAVGANTCASPVQPMRSSRCGQSVGTSRKFPFWPQTMLLWSWLTSGFDVTISPAFDMSEWTTIPVTLSGVSVPG